MKTIDINYFSTYILIITSLLSCVQTDDFNIPNVEIEEPNIVPNSDIFAVKNAFNQSGQKLYTFDENDTTIIEAFVISSDEGGNFYKTLFVQDKYEYPSSGIEVLIDLRAYFTRFNFGRKIYIKMAGLSVSNDEGKYKIGYNSRNEVEEIPESLIDEFIFRSSVTAEIIPKSISLSNLSNDLIGLYVEIKNVQFRNDEIGKTYAGEKHDEFDGERVLLQCDNQLTTILSTSTFSDFKSNLLPENKGSLKAVLTKDYSSEKFILVLNNISYIDFLDEKRCDPKFLYCDINSDNVIKMIFYEDFENIKKTEDLEDLGWKNINLNFGKEKYEKGTFGGNDYMRVSAYNSEENPLEAWLITPSINLDNSIDEIFTFETKASYDNGTILTAWISTDFSGDIREATWQQLDVIISVGPSNSYGSEYTSSGKTSLSCLKGTVNIALRYLGGDPGIGTTFEIDNFKILGN